MCFFIFVDILNFTDGKISEIVKCAELAPGVATKNIIVQRNV